MRAKPLRIFFFVGRRGEQHNVRAHRAGQLYAHVSQAAQAHDADFLSLVHFPVAQRRVSCNAGAEQRRHSGKIGFVGNVQNKILVHHNAL